ncbi:MAG: hypothetical protein JWQ38_181 [Flavipsychrobacter sp.]|nr:hypothetical protein [Flavipsychrobacter sp.]
MKHANNYFENNTVDRLYFTSDNLAFFDEQNAKNHAKKLDDPTITSITREEADQAVNDLVNGQWDDDLFDDIDTQ